MISGSGTPIGHKPLQPLAGHTPAAASSEAHAASAASAVAKPAPAAATPVANLVSDETGSTAVGRAADDELIGDHQSVQDKGASPLEGGFFKGLLSKAMDFFKANTGAVIGGTVLLGGLALVTGGAVLLPALIGLAASGATLAAMNTFQKPPGLDGEEQDADPSDRDAAPDPKVTSPQQFEEAQRRAELEAKLQAQQGSAPLLDFGSDSAAPSVNREVENLIDLGTSPAPRSEYAEVLSEVDFGAPQAPRSEYAEVLSQLDFNAPVPPPAAAPQPHEGDPFKALVERAKKDM